jgi:hypothetical protein
MRARHVSHGLTMIHRRRSVSSFSVAHPSSTPPVGPVRCLLWPMMAVQPLLSPLPDDACAITSPTPPLRSITTAAGAYGRSDHR